MEGREEESFDARERGSLSLSLHAAKASLREPSEGLRSPFWLSYSAEDASKSVQAGAKSAMIASKMPVKRLSDAFSVDDAIRNPF